MQHQTDQTWDFTERESTPSPQAAAVIAEIAAAVIGDMHCDTILGAAVAARFQPATNPGRAQRRTVR